MPPKSSTVSKIAKVTLAFWVMKILATTLGETAGHFLVNNIGLSFIQGALVTAGAIAVVAALHYFTRLNEILLFWIAFIFSRLKKAASIRRKAPARCGPHLASKRGMRWR